MPTPRWCSALPTMFSLIATAESSVSKVSITKLGCLPVQGPSARDEAGMLLDAWHDYLLQARPLLRLVGEVHSERRKRCVSRFSHSIHPRSKRAVTTSDRRTRTRSRRSSTTRSGSTATQSSYAAVWTSRRGTPASRAAMMNVVGACEGGWRRAGPCCRLSLVPQASHTRSPLSPSRTASAAWGRSYRSAVEQEDAELGAVHASRAVDGWTRGRRTCWAGSRRCGRQRWANR